MHAVVVDHQLPIDCQARAVGGRGDEAVGGSGVDGQLAGPLDHPVRAQLGMPADPGARLGHDGEVVVAVRRVDLGVLRAEAPDRHERAGAVDILGHAVVEIGAEGLHRRAGLAERDLRVVDREGFGGAGAIAGTVGEDVDRQGGSGVGDPLEGGFATHVEQTIGAGAEAECAGFEQHARTFDIARMVAVRGQRLREDRHAVDQDVEAIGLAAAAPVVDQRQQERQVDRVVVGQGGEREGGMAGAAGAGVLQEIAGRQAGRQCRQRGVFGDVEVAAQQPAARDRRHIAGGGNRHRPGEDAGVRNEQVAIGGNVQHVPRIAEQHGRGHHLSARGARRIPGERDAGRAGELEHLDADVVVAGGEIDAAGPFLETVQAVVVDHQLAVDEQARPVVGPEEEVVHSRGVDADLAAPAHGEEIVELGEAVEARPESVGHVDLRIDARTRRRQGIEVDVGHARVVAQVDVERQVEVLAQEPGVGLDVLLRPVGAPVDDVDPLLVGADRKPEEAGLGLRHCDRDVAEPVAVDVADAMDVGDIGRAAREHRRRQRQRDRRQQLVAVQAERRPERQARQALRPATADAVAHRDDRVVEAVAVDIADRDVHRLAEQFDRREARRRLLRADFQGVAKRGLEADLVGADAEIGHQRLAGTGQAEREARVVVGGLVVERPVVVVRGEIEHLVTRGERIAVARLLELPVALEAGLGAGDLTVEVTLDVVGGARDVPDPDLVDLAGEILPVGACLAAADRKVVLAADAADVAAALEGMDQHAVGIGVDPAAIEHHGDLGPDILLRDVSGVDPGPARIPVRESPPDRAVGEAGNLVLPFLVQDDAATAAAGSRAGRTDPRFHGHLAGHGQAGRIAHLHDVRGVARRVLAVERERPPGKRGVGLDRRQDVQQVVVGHAGEALARHQLPARTRIGVFRREQIGVELDVLDRLEQHAGIDRLHHLDHVVGELPVGGGAELADGLGRAQHVPVAGVPEMEVQAADDGSLADLGQLPGIQRRIVARRHAVARLKFVGIGCEHVIAGQQVARRPAADRVVAAESHDHVGAGAAVDAVTVGAAEQPVIAIPAADVERGQGRPGLQVAFLDAPLGLGVRELELRVRVHDVIAAARVDDGVLDVHRLVVRGEQPVDRRAIGERREAEFGDRGAGRIGAEIESGAVGAEPQHAIGKLHHHLARADRRRAVDERLQVGCQIGERAVVVGDRLGERQRDELATTGHLQAEGGVGAEPARQRPGLGGADDLLVDHEVLVGGIPLQGTELVAVQEDVVAKRHEIGNTTAETVDVATLEQHAVVAATAVEAVGQRLQAFLAVVEQRRAIRNDLEGVVALAAEQEVFGLAIEAAGQHVVAGTAEDPVFARATLQHIVAIAAQDHVAALDQGLVGEIPRRRVRRRAQIDREAVGGRDLLRRIDPQQVVARRESGKGQHAVLLAGEVERAGAQIGHLGRVRRIGRADLRDQRVARRGAGGRHAHIVVAGREILQRNLQPEHPGRRRIGELDAGGVQQFELDRIALAGLDQADAIVRRADRGQRELEHVDVGRPVEREAHDLRQALDQRQHVGRGHGVVRAAGVGGVLRQLQYARTADRSARRGVEGDAESVEIGGTGELDVGARQCRRGEREAEPVGIVRVVDGQTLDLEIGGQRRIRQRTREIAGVVALVAIGAVDEDRIAGIDGDLVVAVTGVDPDGLLHRRTDRDRVVAAHRIDQDDIVVAFAGQQLVREVGLAEIEIVEREVAVVWIRRDRGRLGGDRVEVEQRFVRVPDRGAVGVLAVGVETDLGGEAEVAVVVGETGDQVVVVQQAGFGDIVDGDDVGGIGRAHVPDLAVLLGVVLPGVAAEQPAIERFEQAAIDPEVFVVAAVAVQERHAGAAVELVVGARAEHAVQTGIFQRTSRLGRIAVEEAVVIGVAVVVEEIAGAVGEHAELSAKARIARPGIESIAPDAADQIVVALSAIQEVPVRGEAVAAVAPQAVVAAEAVDDIAAAAAIEPVAAVAADQQIVAGAAVEDADEVVGARDQRRQVEREHGAVGLVLRAERDVVVAAQALHAELLDERRLRRVVRTPHRRDIAARETRRDRVFVDVLDIEPAVGALAERDGVVVVGALDDQDVGGVVVGDILLLLVAEVAVEGLVDPGRQCVVIGTDIEHQVVDAAAAVERVDAVLAFEPVTVRAAPKLVVAAAAIELVLAAAAEQAVIGADHVGERAEPVQRAVERVAVQIVVAAVAEQRVLAQVAVELVVAGAAVQFVADEQAFGRDRGWPVDDAHGRIREQRVDAVATIESLAGLLALDRARVAADARIALATGIAVEEVRAGIAVELVDAGAAEQRVGVVAAADHVVTGIAVHEIGILATVDIVRIGAAMQHILVTATEDEVDAGAAVDGILPVAGRARHGQIVQRHRVDARGDETGRESRLVNIETEGRGEVGVDR